MTSSNAPKVAVTRSGATLQSKQGLTNIDGVSAELSGSQALWLGMIRIPPGGQAKAHMHENHETAIYVLQGEAGMWYGDELQEHVTMSAGDFLYIPAGIPHVPYNPSQTEEIVGIAARTDPNEQESVILLPELERFLQTM